MPRWYFVLGHPCLPISCDNLDAWDGQYFREKKQDQSLDASYKPWWAGEIKSLLRTGRRRFGIDADINMLLMRTVLLLERGIFYHAIYFDGCHPLLYMRGGPRSLIKLKLPGWSQGTVSSENTFGLNHCDPPLILIIQELASRQWQDDLRLTLAYTLLFAGGRYCFKKLGVLHIFAGRHMSKISGQEFWFSKSCLWSRHIHCSWNFTKSSGCTVGFTQGNVRKDVLFYIIIIL